MVLLGATVVILTGSATATAQFNPGPVDFPDPSFVGQTALPAVYEARNTSTPPESFTSLVVDSMTLIPSCSNFSPGCSGGTADPGVFRLSPTGTGEANTACAGLVFNIGLVNPVTGEVAFTPPPGPLEGPSTSVPNPNAVCRIDFTVDVLRVPVADSDPTTPGIQTNQVGFGVAHVDGPTGPIFVTGGGSLSVTVLDAPAISTVAVPTALVGDPITDTAFLSGGVNPTGTITFAVFGAADSTCLNPLFTSNVNVAGNGSYVSGPFFAASPETYKWRASYSGDSSNQPLTSPCDDPSEVTVVSNSTVLTTTVSSSSVPVGTAVHDTAILSGVGPQAGGTVTFTVFGPNDLTCSGPPAFSPAPVAVSGDGNYDSPDFTPTTAGTYRFIAIYGGDPLGSSPAATACNDAGETVVATMAGTTLATSATPFAPFNRGFNDTATLSLGVNPTGRIVFTLFGPGNTTCSGLPVFTSADIPVSGNGSYPSPFFVATQAGNYQWVATYSGDVNNAPAATPCGDPAETTIVGGAPVISTTASPSVPIGGAIHDTALLTNIVPPVGTTGFSVVSFSLFGPGDPTCTGPPVFTSTALVNGSGAYDSASFNPTATGLYRWVAFYQGNIDNDPAGPTACDDPNESVLVTPLLPPLTTNASASVEVGGAIFDTAILTLGEMISSTGTMTFDLFGPGDPTCAGAPVSTATVPVAGDGGYVSPDFATTAVGTYRFVASYVDVNYGPFGPTACGDPGEAVDVVAAQPSLTTLASAPVAVGGTIHDTATVFGGFNPTGTVTFNVYGPDDPNCAATPAFTATVAVSGNGNYDSPDFTVTPATGTGVYRFTAVYSGDANNEPGAPTPCSDPLEQVLVDKVSPVVTTTASGSVPVGGVVNDTATLTGGAAPTGTLTFSLFGPGDVDCTGPLFTSTVTVSGNGVYAPPTGFTTTAPGTYRFAASYSGDANNRPFTASCFDPAEAVEVSADISLTTTAMPAAEVGGAIDDTATLIGGVGPPTGTITFSLFGPGDSSCLRPLFTSSVAVSGNGTYRSDPFFPTAPGTYQWRGDYSGDANNGPAATACNDPAETTLVTPGVSLSTSVSSASVLAGTPVHDTATLSGGTISLPLGGTVTFTVFGPDDSACSGPAAQVTTVPVTGQGAYDSPEFVPTQPGVYRYMASYSGDANNIPAGPTPCDDPAEQVTVEPNTGSVSVTKVAPADAQGVTFTFTITCPGAVGSPFTTTVTGSGTSVPVDGIAAGTVCTAAETPTPGFDPQPDQVFPAVCACADQTVTFFNTRTPPPLPSIAVVKTASPPSLPESGGVFTFSVVVTNTSMIPLTLIVLDDDVYGNLDGQGTCAEGATLAANGGTYSCTFSGTFNGVGGQTQTDTVTATGVDDRGNQVSATDDAIVAITTNPPSITVRKSATPSSLPEPGGTFTFTATVNNTSSEALILTGFTDNVYGDLNGQGTCSVPQTLAVGGSYTCTFPGGFNGTAPISQTDTVTARVVNSRGQQAMASDDAIVTLTPVAPSIGVAKSAAPPTRPAPGGTFTFTVVVTNTGVNRLTITRLTDDVYGDLNGQGTCAIGAILSPGGSYICSFVGSFTGVAAATQTDTVTATGADVRGQTATASDTATVRLIGAPIARLSAIPSRGPGPLAATFDGSTSTAGAGTTLSSWTLDFGEGAPASGTGSPPSPTATHTYTGVGPHTATLTVTQSDSQTASAQATVVVVPPQRPPPTTPPPPPTTPPTTPATTQPQPQPTTVVDQPPPLQEPEVTQPTTTPTTVAATIVAPTTAEPTTTSTSTTLPPVVVPPAMPPTFNVDQLVVEPGGRLTGSGTGCTPGARVELLIDNRVVGTTTADRTGRFTGELFSAGPEVGHYDVVVRCGPESTDSFDVILQSETGTGTGPIIVILIFLVLGAAAAGRLKNS